MSTTYVYVSICSDDRVDPVVRVHTADGHARAAVGEWIAEQEARRHERIPVEVFNSFGSGGWLVDSTYVIREGTGYEGRYEASIYRREVEG